MMPVPAFPMIPQSWTEVKDRFGDIQDFILTDGTLSPSWELAKVARVVLPTVVPYAYGPQKIREVTIHVALVPLYKELLSEIWANGLETALGPYGGGFTFRANRNNGAVLSLHSYALAQDWDPEGFPNGSPKRRDPKLTEVMLKYGFMCGQDFKHTKDAMHWQFARNI